MQEQILDTQTSPTTTVFKQPKTVLVGGYHIEQTDFELRTLTSKLQTLATKTVEAEHRAAAAEHKTLELLDFVANIVDAGPEDYSELLRVIDALVKQGEQDGTVARDLAGSRAVTDRRTIKDLASALQQEQQRAVRAEQLALVNTAAAVAVEESPVLKAMIQDPTVEMSAGGWAERVEVSDGLADKATAGEEIEKLHISEVRSQLEPLEQVGLIAGRKERGRQYYRLINPDAMAGFEQQTRLVLNQPEPEQLPAPVLERVAPPMVEDVTVDMPISDRWVVSDLEQTVETDQVVGDYAWEQYDGKLA